MISFIRKGILIIMACVGGVIGGCESKKVPLNKEQFTNLLIDLHKVDGTLSVYRGIGQGYNELKIMNITTMYSGNTISTKRNSTLVYIIIRLRRSCFRRCMTWLSIVYTGNSQLLKSAQ